MSGVPEDHRPWTSPIARPTAGSRDHEEEDAKAFADWGTDFLKYDNCWAPASDWVIDRYTAMSAALNKTGRPIVYSMCDWGVGDPWLWAPKVTLSRGAVMQWGRLLRSSCSHQGQRWGLVLKASLQALLQHMPCRGSGILQQYVMWMKAWSACRSD